jgi:hypothetical protein
MMEQLGLTAEDETPVDEAVDDAADDELIFVALPDGVRMSPKVTPNAIAMVRGTAIRTARSLLPRRRHADRWPLSIQSTSICGSVMTLRGITVNQRGRRAQEVQKIRVLSVFKQPARPKPWLFIAKFLRRR